MKLTDSRLIAWSTLAVPLLTVGALAAAVIVDRTHARDAIAANTHTGQDHENRIRTVERGLAELRGAVNETNVNVAWIKSFLQRPPAKGCPQTARNE